MSGVQKTKYARLLKKGDKFYDYGKVRVVEKDAYRRSYDLYWQIHTDARHILQFDSWDRVKLA